MEELGQLAVIDAELWTGIERETSAADRDLAMADAEPASESVVGLSLTAADLESAAETGPEPYVEIN